MGCSVQIDQAFRDSDRSMGCCVQIDEAFRGSDRSIGCSVQIDQALRDSDRSMGCCVQIDEAFRGSDREAVEMAQYLLRNDGLFVGSSAAMNCVGAVKAARALGPGHTIVTVLCDGGHRHLSKFANADYLRQHALAPQCSGTDLSFVS